MDRRLKQARKTPNLKETQQMFYELHTANDV